MSLIDVIVSLSGPIVVDAGVAIMSIESITHIWDGSILNDAGIYILSVEQINHVWDGSYLDLGLHTEIFLGDTFPIGSVSGGHFNVLNIDTALTAGRFTDVFCVTWSGGTLTN